VPLRAYLAGHLVLQGQLAFEAGLDPWVKGKMRRHFAEPPGSEHSAAAAARDAAAEAGRTRLAQITEAELPPLLTAAAAAATSKEEKKEAGDAKKKAATLEAEAVVLAGFDPLAPALEAAGFPVAALLAGSPPAGQSKQKWQKAAAKTAGVTDKALQQLIDATNRDRTVAAEGPRALWLDRAREAVGPKLRGHMNDDGKIWDLYTLTAVTQGYLPPTFRGNNKQADVN
jgi:hypothetical protein